MAPMSAPVKAILGGGGGAGAVTMMGFDTVDEHPAEVLHGPVVIVAVLTTVPVALAATTALNVAVALLPAARLTSNVQVLPDVLVTLQVSLPVTAHDGVPWIVRFDGKVSVIVAAPAPSPTFLMVT